MGRAQVFLAATWSERWKESYADLPADRQVACDPAALALIKQQLSPGLRVKPILPDKFYLEAGINSGDRIVFRAEAGTVFFVDVVKHDDIGRFGKRPKLAR
jgi:hypothetical protein